MTVVVSFIRAAGLGALNTPGVGACRIRENITIPGTTAAALQDGEFAIVGNAEVSMVAVAFGTTPDAAATAATSVSSAGYPVPAGMCSDPIVAPAGSKINVKALA